MNGTSYSDRLLLLSPAPTTASAVVVEDVVATVRPTEVSDAAKLELILLKQVSIFGSQ